jgi:hypothetical protein
MVALVTRDGDGDTTIRDIWEAFSLARATRVSKNNTANGSPRVLFSPVERLPTQFPRLDFGQSRRAVSSLVRAARFEYASLLRLSATLRHDDACGNGEERERRKETKTELITSKPRTTGRRQFNCHLLPVSPSFEPLPLKNHEHS